MTARKDLIKNEVIKEEDVDVFIYQSAKANKKETLTRAVKDKIVDVYDLSKAAQQIALENIVDTQALDLLISIGAHPNYAVSGAAFAGHADLVNSLISRGAKADLATEAAAYGGQFSLVEQLVKRHTILLFFPIEGALRGNQLQSKLQAHKALMSFQDPKVRLRFAKEVDSRECLDFKLCSLLVADSIKKPKYSFVNNIAAFFQYKDPLIFAKFRNMNSDENPSAEFLRQI